MTHPLINSPLNRTVAVIGGGPAGLMAAEVLAQGGAQVDLYDAMPSVGRKFLLAGKGGMNITHAEPYADFVTRYRERTAQLRPILDQFGPDALRAWMAGLGIASLVGSSKRVFPADMKAAPLLRRWLHRLRDSGVRIHTRHRWIGWDDNGQLLFASPDAGAVAVPTPAPAATVLALGGGSWARLGSDGAWVPHLLKRGIDVAPLQPANCGFEVDWSAHFASRFAGQPVKSVAISVTGPDGCATKKKGEFIISESGVEGSLIYAFSGPLRDAITAAGTAAITLDLLPDWPAQRVHDEVTRPRGARSLASHLQSRLSLTGVKAGLLREQLGAQVYHDTAALAQAIKALTVTLRATRPLDEAISSAGGVRFEAMNAALMLQKLPGVFCVGELLDWEAPTGGYLLTACFASGRTAGAAALEWLAGVAESGADPVSPDGEDA
jgi:uncharacterized flavoprotein (TIGR03862 family)